MSQIMKCPHCKNTSFQIIVTRSKDPLINDDEFYCSECGKDFSLPIWVPSKDRDNEEIKEY